VQGIANTIGDGSTAVLDDCTRNEVAVDEVGADIPAVDILGTQASHRNEYGVSLLGVMMAVSW